MSRQVDVRVGKRPDKPQLVFDGECGFCRQWVERWRSMAGDRAEFRPFQEAAPEYPEVGWDGFRSRVWLIEPDGQATSGARAVFRLYDLAGDAQWLNWAYGNMPSFARVSESVYNLVAGHRDAAAVLTRCLWGDVSERPHYGRVRSVFLRMLGLVYLAAFASLGVQVLGLIGHDGILPAADFLRDVKRGLGSSAYWQLPTVFWIDASDGMLDLVCWGGVVVAALLAAGVAPLVCAIVLWVGYLSLTVVGQEFLGFQWDALLLETGLLAIFLSPRSLWLKESLPEPHHAWIWLLRWLVFRIMFLSGLVKLTSGDANWRTWRALRYHYETQPLPTWTSWYMHQLPGWFQTCSTGLMFWAELIAPFFVFFPRRLRFVAFWSTIALQVAIAATGNYGFFNILTCVLCLALLEDRDLRRRKPAVVPAPRPSLLRTAMVAVVSAVIVIVTTMEGMSRTSPLFQFPVAFEVLRQSLEPLHSLNAYGLFAVMTTERPEILVEGSADGVTWVPYHFRWKPGNVNERPRFTTPHMPRLDWQMWFAALAVNCRYEPWFLKFEVKLLENSPSVLGLLRDNPFPDRPPRYVRARLFFYRFTSRGSPDWWQRTDGGFYCPPIGLKSTIEQATNASPPR